MTRPTSKIINPTNNKAAIKAIKDERKKLAVQEATATAGVKCATSAVALLNKSITKEIAALEKQRAATVKAAQKALDAATKELERTAADVGKQFKAQLTAAQKELDRALKVETKVKAATAKAIEKLDAKEHKLTGGDVKISVAAQPKNASGKEAPQPKPKAKQTPVNKTVDAEDELNDEAGEKVDSDRFALF